RTVREILGPYRPLPRRAERLSKLALDREAAAAVLDHDVEVRGPRPDAGREAPLERKRLRAADRKELAQPSHARSRLPVAEDVHRKRGGRMQRRDLGATTLRYELVAVGAGELRLDVRAEVTEVRDGTTRTIQQPVDGH